MSYGDGHIMNPNLSHLVDSFDDEKSGAILEGSSRSGKTWSGIDFIVRYCSTVSQNSVINILRETYNSFKTTLYDDFNRRLPMYGISSPFVDRQELSQFKLFGNKINLLGTDNESRYLGASCDLFWCNEMLDIPKGVFDQQEQRCRRFWWGDFNPKATDHWVYNATDNRKDVSHLKTTLLDNPDVSPMERRKIMGYEPTKKNIEEGTADDYLWNVYGLGLRSAPEGLIFQNVTWVKEFPTDCEKVYYGIDFGYTHDPTALTRIGIMGNKLFGEVLFYAPTPSFNELSPVLDLVPEGEIIWADPSGEYGGRGLITLARRNGYRVYAFNAFPGSVLFGLGLMKKYKIHFVSSAELKKEQANYKHKQINGIKLEEPIDAYNHAIDSMRGAAIANLIKQ